MQNIDHGTSLRWVGHRSGWWRLGYRIRNRWLGRRRGNSWEGECLPTNKIAIFDYFREKVWLLSHLPWSNKKVDSWTHKWSQRFDVSRKWGRSDSSASLFRVEPATTSRHMVLSRLGKAENINWNRLWHFTDQEVQGYWWLTCRQKWRSMHSHVLWSQSKRWRYEADRTLMWSSVQ